MNEMKPGNAESVKEVVRSAQNELAGLLRQRADLMTRIGTIKKTLSGLARIFGDSILNEDLLALMDRAPSKRQSGLTKACRIVLMEAVEPCTAEEICENLERKFSDVWQRQKNPIASITTVLNRLVEYSEARSGWNENRRRVWQWSSSTSQMEALRLMEEDVSDDDPLHEDTFSNEV